MEEKEGMMAEEEDMTGALRSGYGKLGAEPGVLLIVFVWSLGARGVGV